MEERTVLLIGKTGNGKSAISNVISGTNDFEEGEFTVSQTKDHLRKEYIVEGVKYIIVDTIGIGDTKLTTQQVLFKIADACYTVRSGLNQVLFCVSGRFTPEEMMCYQILTTVIFNPEIVKNTTIIRTRFPKFRNSEACQADINSMASETSQMASIVMGCNKIIHVNNQTEEEDPGLISRKDSRIRLLTHLFTCRDLYLPKELTDINGRIKDYMTKAENFEAKIAELTKIIEQTNQTNKDLLEKLNTDIAVYKKSLDDVKIQVSEITGGVLREKSPGVWEFICKSFRKCSVQ
ncbi:hypothetical protein CYY_005285 [Polysphondylium violaceum]|uniref:AIG1-type G domain-containing protein n=1 Tax=Polysphondylium violaceum TaxID=133409 RepID=A0A8J4Q3G2_9MYCE|nr:hypothetical protein CYY_005285 [Polysphondylium violaceum]